MASSSNRRGKAKTSQPWTTTKDIALCKLGVRRWRTTREPGFGRLYFDNFQKEMGEAIRGLKCQHTNNVATLNDSGQPYNVNDVIKPTIRTQT
nr:hypothetical protein [Tanacetum cinerariifolium]